MTGRSRERGLLLAFRGEAAADPEEPTQGHTGGDTGGGVGEPPAPGPTAAVTCAVLDAAGIGRVLGVSRSKVHDLDAKEALPAPFLVGRARRWSRVEVEAWVLHGAPKRAAWERAWPRVRRELLRW